MTLGRGGANGLIEMPSERARRVVCYGVHDIYATGSLVNIAFGALYQRLSLYVLSCVCVNACGLTREKYAMERLPKECAACSAI